MQMGLSLESMMTFQFTVLSMCTWQEEIEANNYNPEPIHMEKDGYLVLIMKSIEGNNQKPMIMTIIKTITTIMMDDDYEKNDENNDNDKNISNLA